MPYRCAYLPDNTAHHFASDTTQPLTMDIYSQLIDLGFRRSGERIHRPNCINCSQCISLRIPASTFKPSRSQKRCLAKNSDLLLNINNRPDYNEYYDLYNHYIISTHPESESMHDVADTFNNFLFSQWSETFAIEFRLPSSELVCVSICDPLIQGWSAVYTFYSPQHSNRSLGSFAILRQIEMLQHQGLSYLYLGYWIRDSQKMNYKSKYKPCEGFINGKWKTVNE
jgi:arginine-tRNA-protein transferase